VARRGNARRAPPGDVDAKPGLRGRMCHMTALRGLVRHAHTHGRGVAYALARRAWLRCDRCAVPTRHKRCASGTGLSRTVYIIGLLHPIGGTVRSWMLATVPITLCRLLLSPFFSEISDTFFLDAQHLRSHVLYVKCILLVYRIGL
jgi:hypothetical protein